MTISRRTSLLALAMLCAVTAAGAQQPAAGAREPQLGRDYTEVVPPQPTTDPQRVVVTEFFSYACPHCASFNPALTAWTAKLPKDVLFERVAVVIGRQPWQTFAQLYYALNALGKAEELSPAVFRAIHAERADWRTDADIVAWVGRQGVDTAQFSAAFKSFSMRSFIARGDQLAAAHKVRGVPTIVIDGKYAVAIDDRVDFAVQLATIDRLVDKARAEKAR
jgi:thiol:disulfide interchange protein DsbA